MGHGATVLGVRPFPDRRIRPRAATFSFVLGVLVGSVAAGPTDEPSGSDPVLRKLVAAHNEPRLAAELGPLTVSPLLEKAARVHARDMAAHSKMTHTGSDGSAPQERIEKAGYRSLRSGENVAEGQRSVERVMRAWLNSPEHKKNILGDFTEIGVARAEDSEGQPFWCVNFGKPWPRLDPSRAAEELTSALNAARRKAGKTELKPNAKLARAAKGFAGDHAQFDQLEVKDKTQQTVVERLEKAGYRYRQLAEALASGPPTVGEAKGFWLEQADTRRDVMGDFTEIGVGYAQADSGTPYWCLILANPVSRTIP